MGKKLLVIALLGIQALSLDIQAQNKTSEASASHFFQSNGALNEQFLPDFLAQAFNAGTIKSKDFSDKKCLEVKKLGSQGGYNTLQLFLITSTCQAKKASYIMKEAREGAEEALKLRAISALRGIEPLILPSKLAGFPSIALPIAYLSYKYNSKEHYLTIMPTAPGIALSSLIDQFRKDPSLANRERLSVAFRILGQESANFHKRFMTPSDKKIGNTIVHGDFHYFNLFYDEAHKHFTFIDNESIANSLKSKISPEGDLRKLFFMPFSINSDYQQFRDLIYNINLKTWLEIAFKNFVIGYIDTYPKQEQKDVLKELRRIFNEPFSVKWIDWDENELNELRNNYINPILDNI